MRHIQRIDIGGGFFREVEAGSPDDAFGQVVRWLHFGKRSEVANALPWLTLAAGLSHTDEDFRDLEHLSKQVDALVPRETFRKYHSGRLKLPLVRWTGSARRGGE